jgi:hypothetical protein
MRTELENIIFGNLGLNDEIENKSKFYKKKNQDKKLKIKRIKIKVEIPTIKKIKL